MIGVRLLAPLLVTIALCAGCSSGADSPPSPSATPAVTRPLGGQVVGAASNDRTHPSYSVQAPAGWSSTGAFVTRNPPSVMGLSVWDAIQVPTDPCRWSSTMTKQGPKVDHVVKVLEVQPAHAGSGERVSPARRARGTAAGQQHNGREGRGKGRSGTRP